MVKPHKVIRREHYHMSTIEIVATGVTKAKRFTEVETKTDFDKYIWTSNESTKQPSTVLSNDFVGSVCHWGTTRVQMYDNVICTSSWKT